MALTKASIVEAVQAETGFTKHQSIDIIESLLELIKSTLETGEDMMLRPRKVVTFKCSGNLRKRVNGGN